MIAIAFIVVFVLVVYTTISRTRKDRQQKKQIALALGFQSIENLPTELAERIFVLHRYAGRGNYHLRNVAFHKTLEGEFYLYDLWDTGGDSNNLVEQGAVAVVTHGLDLPQMTIFPRLDMTGKFIDLANRFIGWAMKRVATEVTLDHPGFQEHYFLAGEDPEAIRSRLTPDLLDYLAENPMLSLHASGDLFTLAYLKFGTAREKVDLESVSALNNHAVRLVTFFSH